MNGAGRLSNDDSSQSFTSCLLSPESMERNASLRHTPRAICYPFHLTTTLTDTPLGWVVPCSKTTRSLTWRSAGDPNINNSN